jgi:hypothetical protein
VTTATLIWTDPTKRVDGTNIAPDTFTVALFDSASPTPNTPIGTVAQGVQTFTTGPLSAGVHTFSTVVSDSEGDASVPETASPVTVTIAAPNPTTGLAVALN